MPVFGYMLVYLYIRECYSTFSISLNHASKWQHKNSLYLAKIHFSLMEGGMNQEFGDA